MGLVILAAALVIVVLYDLNSLVQYKECMNKSVTELSQHCQEVLSGE